MIAILLAGLIIPFALAALGTPVGGSTVSCEVQPRTMDEMQRFVDMAPPTTGEDLEPYIIAETALPVGEPAGQPVIHEITTLLSIRVACLLDHDAFRFYALYTDRYLVDLISFEGSSAADWIRQTGTPPAGSTGQPDYRLGSLDRAFTLTVDGVKVNTAARGVPPSSE